MLMQQVKGWQETAEKAWAVQRTLLSQSTNLEQQLTAAQKQINYARGKEAAAVKKIAALQQELTQRGEELTSARKALNEYGESSSYYRSLPMPETLERDANGEFIIHEGEVSEDMDGNLGGPMIGVMRGYVGGDLIFETRENGKLIYIDFAKEPLFKR